MRKAAACCSIEGKSESQLGHLSLISIAVTANSYFSHTVPSIRDVAAHWLRSGPQYRSHTIPSLRSLLLVPKV